MRTKIIEFIETWENRCYPELPDSSPIEIYEKVPSYQRCALAILKNDHSLRSLGFIPKKSEWYSILKSIELKIK